METLRRYVEGEQTETIKAVPTDYGKTLKDTLNGEGTVIPVDEGVKINDNSLSKNQTWSSDKLNGLFNDKVNKSDVKSEITEDDTNPVNSIAVLGELENYDTSSEVTSKITESISDYNETIESGLMQPGTEQTFTGKKTFSNGVDVGSLSEDGDTINIEVLKDNAGNSGQILKVNDEGVPEWEDVAGAVVDQTFNPTSVNAQSGKAVNEAVTDSVDQTYSASSTKAQSGVAVASGIDSAIQTALESLVNEKFTKYDSDGVNIDNTLGNYVVEVTENNEGTLPEETTEGIVVQFNSGSTIAQIDYVTTDDGVIAYVRKYENSTWSEWEVSSGGSSKPILLTRAEYDALGGNYEPDTFYVITDENVTGITVDQTYNATSGNPQSGKAVAEGLENALDDYYTKDESKNNFPRFPDYTQRINIGTATTWTATEDCYVNYVNNSDVLRINNTIQSVSANNINIFSGYIKKNDILSSTSLRSDWGCCKIYKLI